MRARRNFLVSVVLSGLAAVAVQSAVSPLCTASTTPLPPLVTVSGDVSCPNGNTLDVLVVVDLVIQSTSATTLSGFRFLIDEGANVRVTGEDFVFQNSETLDEGGVFKVENGTLTFESAVTFFNNTAESGAAILNKHGAVKFLSSATFANNTASNGGGALATFEGPDGIVTFTSAAYFKGNTAGTGGALSILAGAVAFDESSVFEDNVATSDDPMVFVNGGAIYVGSAGDLTGMLIMGGAAKFTGNTGFSGGAIAIFGAATFGGNVIFDSNYADYGGAVSIGTDGAATFAASVSFINNNAAHGFGGAFYIFGGNATFGGNVIFDSNSAGWNGGAVFINKDGAATFAADVSFINNNVTQDGGAIAINGGDTTFGGNVLFDSNYAQENGGGVYLTSGAVKFEASISFLKNNARYGGALYIPGGRIVHSSTSYLPSSQTSLSSGVEIYRLGGKLTFGASALFVGNFANEDGGALWTAQALPFFNMTFMDNRADGNGGAIYGFLVPDIVNPGDSFHFEDTEFTSNSASLKGGAICIDGCDSMYIVNVTASNNSATDGGFVSALSCSVGWFASTATSNIATGRGGALMLSLAPSYPPYNAPWLSSALSSTSSYSTPSYSPASYSSLSSSTSNSASTVFQPSSIISYVHFDSNGAGTGGGALMMDSSDIYIDACTFVNGTAESGGAVYYGAFLQAEMDNCTLEDNLSVSSGGAVYVGSSTVLNVTDAFYRNCTSSAGAGGAILGDTKSQVTLTNVTIKHSTAALYGGGVAMQSSARLIVSASTISESSSQCCFSDDAENPYASFYACGDVNFGGTSSSDCCLRDQYWYDETCVTCDSVTMDCSTVGVSISTISLTAGYWRAADYSTDIRECLNPDACGGGNGVGSFGLNQYCNPGYVGQYCAVCEAEYFSTPGRKCTKCASTMSTGMIVWGMVLLTLFVCAIGAVTLYLVMDQNDTGFGEHQSWWRIWITKFANLQWGRLRIPIVAAQIVSQCVAVTGTRLPPAYETFLAWASFASLDFNTLPALDCLVSTNFYDRLLFVTLIPLCGALYLCLTYFVVVLKHRRVRGVSSFASTSGDSFRIVRLEKAKAKHFRAFLILTFLVYSTVSATVFQTFAVEKVLDSPNADDLNNYSYLRVDFSVSASSPQHTRYSIYAAVMVFIYPIGIPAMYTCLLWCSRDHFTNVSAVGNSTEPVVDSEPAAPSSALQHAQDSSLRELEGAVAKQSRITTNLAPHVVESARFLWSGYTPRFYYWESLECLRRVLMTGIVIFLFPGTSAQISLTCLFAQVSIIIISICRPHADVFDFLLYLSGSVLVFLTMYLGLNMKVDVGDESAQSQAAFSALLITLHVGIMVAAFVNMCLVAKATVDGRQQILISAVNLS